MVHVWNPHSGARLSTYKVPRKHSISTAPGAAPTGGNTSAAGGSSSAAGGSIASATIPFPVTGTHDNTVHVVLHIPGQHGSGWVCAVGVDRVVLTRID